MEDVRLLARAVIRAFYTDEHAVLMEPLLNEPYYLRDDQTTFGSLYQTMGGLHAKKSRQVLTELVEHGLIGKWESQTEVEKGQKVYYYYCDFVHFVKTVYLRIHLMEKRMQDDSSERVAANTPEFQCPKCNRTFTVMDALKSCPESITGTFTCPDDRSVLNTIQNVTNMKKKASSETYKQFEIQMKSERDLRDEGIKPLLERINANASGIVEIRPPFRKRTADGITNSDGKNPGSGSGNSSSKTRLDNDIYLEESVEKIRPGSQVPTYLQHSSVTGEKTEEANVKERERYERELREKTQANEAQQIAASTEFWKKQMEMDEQLRQQQQQQNNNNTSTSNNNNNETTTTQSPTSLDNNNVIYVTVGGKRIAIENVTEADIDKMTEEEYFDYTAKCDE
jgi:transcription initiation factor IIE alpha subunit